MTNDLLPKFALMFTGIVEALAEIQAVEVKGGNRNYRISSPITQELKIDQSVAHNGVCLTVVAVEGSVYTVTAVDETLKKTTLGDWQPGKKLNLERSLRVGDRLDGHFVQGHVDAVAECIEAREADGSWIFRFRFPEEFAPLMVEKGSACIDGVSLTVFGLGRNEFSVTIIPYTFGHTGFGQLRAGDRVNIEFDVLGKYFLRHRSLAAPDSIH
jgi:riboflavin synthase